MSAQCVQEIGRGRQRAGRVEDGYRDTENDGEKKEGQTERELSKQTERKAQWTQRGGKARGLLYAVMGISWDREEESTG